MKNHKYLKIPLSIEGFGVVEVVVTQGTSLHCLTFFGVLRLELQASPADSSELYFHTHSRDLYCCPTPQVTEH